MFCGNECDGLAEVPHAVEGEHGLVAELEAVALVPGHVLVRENGVDTSMPSAAPRSIETILACACGLRSV